MSKRYYNITMVQETVATYGGYFESVEQAIASFEDINYKCDHIATTFGGSRIICVEEAEVD